MIDNKLLFRCIVIIALVAIIIYALLCLFVYIYKLPLKNAPEQQAEVVVADKNIILKDNAFDGWFERPNKYFVKFQFPDGSIKELDVSIKGADAATSGNFYYTLSVGDKGTLTYKEIENIEEKYDEEKRYKGREFISFERDSLSNAK